ncbi:MAG: hypothetical protein M1820_005240 [Bogoriella megaspora]|nr:MAG: hypothetical protein M1820_005240 [Bogoriella megaspora]
MTEILSVTASIAGILSLADLVVENLIRYARQVKSARKDISALLQEAASLSGVLKALSLLAKQLENDRQVDSAVQTHHITSCATVLLRLQDLLNAKDADSAKNPLVAAKRMLLWPLSKSEADNICKELERHKSTLSLALGADSFTALVKACSRHDSAITDGFDKLNVSMNQIQREIESTRTIFVDENRGKVLDFFGTVDPKVRHNTAFELLHPGTGLWFTEGEEFRSWCSESNAKLWITGIPGAGKTILMARIIDNLQRSLSTKDCLAYFYCDYKDAATHDIWNILGSLLKQLAVRSESAFSILEDCYKKQTQEGTKLSAIPTNELCELVKTLGAKFDDAMIVIDGLDERGGDRGLLPSALQSTVCPDENGIKILFASRDELDIRLQLHNVPEVSVAARSSDLKLYVLSEIERRTTQGHLNIRRAALKEEIMQKLVEKAQGMFRWVACQIDYLCELSSDKERRDALDSLPPTLIATYERILARVNDRGEKVQNLVRKSLLWLAHAQYDIDGLYSWKLPVTTAKMKMELAFREALSVGEDTTDMDVDDVIDLQAISKHCGSLVRRSQSAPAALELAHFTVEEFLRGISVDDISFAKYRLDKHVASEEIAKTCLRYLNLETFSTLHLACQQDLEDVLAAHPLLLYAATGWMVYTRENPGDGIVQRLLHQLFAPHKSENFQNWATMALYKQDGVDFKLASQASVLHFACFFSLPEVTQWLLDSGVRVDQATHFGYPIHFAVAAQSTVPGHWYDFEDLWYDSDKGDREHLLGVINLLIKYRTQIDSSNANYPSPIQIACYHDWMRWDSHADCAITKALLEAGAAVDRGIFFLLDMESSSGQSDWSSISSFKRSVLSTVNDGGYEIIDKDWFVDTAVDLDASSCHAMESSSLQLDSRRKLLCRAIENGQAQKVATLVSGSLDFADCTVQGLSLLMYAAKYDLLEVLEVLLSHGANVYQQNSDHSTVLHYAAQGASSRVVHLLIRKDVDLEPLNDSGETPLMFAARFGNLSAVEAILSAANVRQLHCRWYAPNGQSLLHFAARSGSLQIFRKLETLIERIDLQHHLDPKGWSCLDFAVQGQSVSLTEFLISRGLRASGRREGGETTFELALKSVNSQIVFENGKTPLHIVAGSDDLFAFRDVLVEKLLAGGALVGVEDSAGQTPLQELCRAALSLLFENWEVWNSAFDLLIRDATKAEINVAGENGPLHHIAKAFLEASRGMERTKYLLKQVLGGLIERASFDTVMSRNRGDIDICQLALDNGNLDLFEKVVGTLERFPREKINRSHFRLILLCCQYTCSMQVFDRVLPFFQKDLSEGHEEAAQAVYIAVKQGCDDLVRRFLDMGRDVDGRWDDLTPLMTAAIYNRVSTVKLLIRHRAQCDLKTERGITAYGFACLNGNLDILFCLDAHMSIQRGKQSELLGEGRPEPVLHLATEGDHTNVIDYLLRNNISKDINGLCQHKSTALHRAAHCGRADAAMLLLEMGADPTLYTSSGVLPLHVAAQQGHLGVAEVILKCHPNLIDRPVPVSGPASISAYNALLFASAGGHVDMVKSLLEKGADPNYTTHKGINAIALALGSGRQDIVSLLAERLSMKNTDGPTGLDRDVSFHRPDHLSESLWAAISNANLELCKQLLDAGADPCRSPNICGSCTPILLAAGRGLVDIAKLLLERGASPYSVLCENYNPRGTAFHMAISQNQPELLNLMLDRGSPPIDGSGRTAIHVAAEYGHTECLVALLNRADHSGLPKNLAINAKSSRVLCFTRKASRQFDSLGGTALHIAVMRGWEHSVRLLVRHGAALECTDDWLLTPFLCAAAVGSLRILRVLAQAGANVYARDFTGSNAINLASARHGNPKMLDELHRLGVSLHQKRYDGSSPLHNASFSGNYHGNYEAASMLVSRGHRYANTNFCRESAFYLALKCTNAQVRALATAFCCNPCIKPHKVLSPIVEALEGHNFEAAKFTMVQARKMGCAEMIDHGSDMALPPLQLAAMRNDTEVIDYVLSEGAGLDVQWRGEGPALKIACEYGCFEATKILVGKGAGTTWTNIEGEREDAIHAARYHEEIAQWLNERLDGDSNQMHSMEAKADCKAQRRRASMPVTQMHRSARKRASFEFEYALSRQESIATFEESKVDEAAKNRNPVQATYAGPPNLTNKVNQRKAEFQHRIFRKRNRPVLARAHDRWNTTICRPAFREHSLGRFLLRTGELSPSTIW